MKKIIILLSIAALIAASTGCATLEYSDKKLSRAEQKKAEKEKDYNFMKGIFSFGGFAAGGLIGVFTAPGSQKLGSMLEGCLIGGLAGFAVGYILTENLKNLDDPNLQPDKSRIDEYFQEYKDINGKE